MLRFAHLGSQSLWIDEVFTWQSAGIGTRLSVADLLQNVHGPLFALIEHSWCAMAGGSESALRTPSALFGVATVPALAWLSGRWLGRETVPWAAWLAACSPFMVWYSQEARPYALLMLWVCLSGALMLEAARGLRRSTPLAYALCALAGLWSATGFAMALPLHARWWLADPLRRRGRLIAGALLIAILALLALPWLPQAVSTFAWHRLAPGRHAEVGETALRGATTFHLAALPYALHVFAVGYTLGPSPRELRADPSAATLRRHAPGIALTAVAFGALAIAGVRALRRRRRLLDAALWVGLPIALVSWFALTNFKVFHPRYLALCVPALLAMSAAALADLAPRAKWLMAGAVGALWALSLAHHYADPRDQKEDHRGAAALVRSRAVAGERALGVNCADLLEYYSPAPAVLDTFWLGYAVDSLKLEEKLGAAMARAPGVWVVLSRSEDLDPAGRFARRMDAKYPDAERYAFTGVRVWHVRRGAVTTAPRP